MSLEGQIRDLAYKLSFVRARGECNIANEITPKAGCVGPLISTEMLFHIRLSFFFFYTTIDPVTVILLFKVKLAAFLFITCIIYTHKNVHMGGFSQNVKRLKMWDFYPLFFGFS